MKEPLRYLRNARQLAASAPTDGRVYTDMKPVREACGTAYLAILEAVDAYLLSQGVAQKELPESVDAYRDALGKRARARNGKLVRDFEALYHSLHIAGYYRADLRHVVLVRDALKLAEDFIKRLGVAHAG
ncbi:MAG: hypothetical protein FJ279_21420 [Planctomycetes bacterium]|nr:hypothetical protein [Planctomycetota bacterium]